MMLFLCLLLAPEQLTWYEYYERGEKLFQKGDYLACIEDMDRALAINPTPKRNQFTRAVLKINYQPFYYKALAYYHLNDVPRAYENAQKAFHGEVVSQSPEMQAELGVVFEAHRLYVFELQNQLNREREILDTRATIMTLLSQGRLEEAAAKLEGISDPKTVADIRLLLGQQTKYQEQKSQFERDAADQIETAITAGKIDLAHELLNYFDRSDLDDALVAQLRTRIEEAAAVLPTVPEQAPETLAQTAALKPAIEDEIANFEDQIRQLQEQKLQLEAYSGSIEQKNRDLNLELARRPDQPLTWAPKIVLLLNRVGSRKIKIEGQVISAGAIKTWEIMLNGKELPIQQAKVVRDERGMHLDYLAVSEGYGDQKVALRVTDQFGMAADRQAQIFLAPPWWRTPRFRLIFAITCLLGLVLLIVSQILLRRRAMLRNFNPYIAGSPVRARDMFYGRDKLLRRIEGLVHKNCFMIHGARRIGKTSLLLQLKQNLQESQQERYRFYPAFIDLQGLAEPDLFHHLMGELLIQAAEWEIDLTDLDFSETHQTYQSRNFSRDMKKLITRLQQRDPRHVLIVLLVDEVDVLNEFDDKTNQKLRSIFMKEYAEHLSCVMAGIHLKKEWESSGSPWYNFFEDISIRPLDDRAARELILNPVRGIFKFRRPAVELLLRATGGHPYLIQKICVRLIDEKLAANRFVVTHADVERGLYEINEEAKGSG